MEHYRELKPEDLVEDLSFRAWIYHGTGDLAWKTWLRKNPDCAQTVELARNILLSVRGELDHLPNLEVKDRVQGILLSLETEKHTVIPSAGRILSRFAQTWWRSAAAGIILAIGLGAILYPKWHRQSSSLQSGLSASSGKSTGAEWVEIANHDARQQLVNLPDGSSVLLMSASTLTYPKHFGPDKREVYLSGEAFFEVQKNTGHPFFVYAGEMATRVIGTSFTIRAYPTDETASVRVKTGKVSVFALGKDPAREPSQNQVAELILEPTQQAMFLKSSQQVERISSDQMLTTIPPMFETQLFEFRRTPVTEVFETIKSAYGIDILYDPDVLENCSITASLGDEPLTEKLNMICEVIAASYRTLDNLVTIEASGCR